MSFLGSMHLKLERTSSIFRRLNRNTYRESVVHNARIRGFSYRFKRIHLFSFKSLGWFLSPRCFTYRLSISNGNIIVITLTLWTYQVNLSFIFSFPLLIIVSLPSF